MGEVVWVVAEGPAEGRARVAEPPGCKDRDMVAMLLELRSSILIEGH
jgi:hypothetical protein